MNELLLKNCSMMNSLIYISFRIHNISVCIVRARNDFYKPEDISSYAVFLSLTGHRNERVAAEKLFHDEFVGERGIRLPTRRPPNAEESGS